MNKKKGDKMEKLKLKRKYVSPSPKGYEVVRIRKEIYLKIAEVANETGDSIVNTISKFVNYAYGNVEYIDADEE